MANTFNLISAVTVGSGGAADITFTSIPATYTDLCLKLSVRSDQGSVEALTLNVNGQGVGTNITARFLDSGAGTPRSGTAIVAGIIQGTDYTSSTFSSNELYFPNYASGNQKSISIDYTTENNAAASYTGFSSLLWAQTAAITSLGFTRSGGGNFVQYTTAYLYGVSNA